MTLFIYLFIFGFTFIINLNTNGHDIFFIASSKEHHQDGLFGKKRIIDITPDHFQIASCNSIIIMSLGLAL